MFLAPNNIIEVEITVNKLWNCSAELDNPRPDSIKLISTELSKRLVLIINLSFEQGILPVEFKMANFIPVFKGGDSSNINFTCFSNNFKRIM